MICFRITLIAIAATVSSFAYSPCRQAPRTGNTAFVQFPVVQVPVVQISSVQVSRNRNDTRESTSLVRPKPPSYQPAATHHSNPLAMRGFSCVSLLDEQKWVNGNREFAAMYQGQRYLLTGPAELEKFRLAPQKYAPALNGDCVVAWTENEIPTSGSVQFTSIYRGKIYLLHSKDAKLAFMKNPQAFVSAVARSVSK